MRPGRHRSPPNWVTVLPTVPRRLTTVARLTPSPCVGNEKSRTGDLSVITTVGRFQSRSESMQVRCLEKQSLKPPYRTPCDQLTIATTRSFNARAAAAAKFSYSSSSSNALISA